MNDNISMTSSPLKRRRQFRNGSFSRVYADNTAYNPEKKSLYVFTHEYVLVIRRDQTGQPKAEVKTRDGRSWKSTRNLCLHIHRGTLNLGDLKEKTREIATPSACIEKSLRYWQGCLDRLNRKDHPDTGQTRNLMKQALSQIRQRQAFLAWRSTFPAEIVETVGRFPSRQFHLLCSLCRIPAGIELARFTPALFWMLFAADRTFLGKDDHNRYRTIGRMLKLRQRRIAHRLGFPDCQAVISILRKIPDSEIRLHPLRKLRNILQDEAKRRILSHLPVIYDWTIEFLYQPRFYRVITPALLYDLTAATSPEIQMKKRGNLYYSRQPHLGILRDILSMEEAMELHRPHTFRSARALMKVHDNLIPRLNRVKQEQLLKNHLNFQLPPPPVPGTDEIIPVITHHMLIQEGLEQDNCIASWLKRIMEGDAYIYRVLSPERATLALSRHEYGEWQFEELLAARNQRVTMATAKAVNEWFHGNNPSPVERLRRALNMRYIHEELFEHVNHPRE